MPPRIINYYLVYALVPLSLASFEKTNKSRGKKGRAGSGGAAGTLYISHNFDVCRGSLTQEVCHSPATHQPQEQALTAPRHQDLMPPKRKARKPADAIDLTEMASPQEKKQKVALTTIAKEFVCPITQELPIQPVTAEDGKIYEETAIRDWFSKKDGEPTSPSTGAVIGTRLFPAPQARNTIEALVKSGAIDGEIAEAWKQKLEDETLVKETRAKAEGGDGDAMCELGEWYGWGRNGLAKDKAQARAWYERAAAARDPKGMAAFGEYLLLGLGGPQDTAFGIMNVTEAAGLGSNVGAMTLGEAFFRGTFGLPKDPVRARFWLRKVADDECAHKHLSDSAIADAAQWLRELDQ